MPSQLQQMIDTFERDAARDIATANRSLLSASLDAYARLAPAERLAPDNVRPAVRVFERLGMRAEKVDLLAQFLGQHPGIEDEAWARWERTDTLATLRRFDDAVESQREFHAWATEYLEAERMLWVMYDGSQALAWWASARLTEWLAMVSGLRDAVSVNEETRWDWFQLDRTEGLVLARDERTDASLGAADRITNLAARFPAWDQAEGVRLEAEFTRMEAFLRSARDVEFDAVADRVIERLSQFPAHHTDASGPPQQFATLCHNAGATLFVAQRYMRAIPLLREAIGSGGQSPHTHIWLGASIWATDRNREAALSALGEARDRDPSRSVWRRASSLAEFGELASGPEFKSACGGT